MMIPTIFGIHYTGESDSGLDWSLSNRAIILVRPDFDTVFTRVSPTKQLTKGQG